MSGEFMKQGVAIYEEELALLADYCVVLTRVLPVAPLDLPEFLGRVLHLAVLKCKM